MRRRYFFPRIHVCCCLFGALGDDLDDETTFVSPFGVSITPTVNPSDDESTAENSLSAAAKATSFVDEFTISNGSSPLICEKLSIGELVDPPKGLTPPSDEAFGASIPTSVELTSVPQTPPSAFRASAKPSSDTDSI